MTTHIEVDVATAEDLQWIGALEQEHYGGQRAVSHARLKEWYLANPNAFFIIREGERRSGHATLLPLRPRMLRALTDGSRNEGHVGAADIYGPHERLRIRDLYVESLIAEPHLLGEFIGKFDRHVSRLADVRMLRRIYACPATPAGRLLMENLNFGGGHGGAYSAAFSALAEQTAAIRGILKRRQLDPVA
jgi:hypothetical protein